MSSGARASTEHGSGTGHAQGQADAPVAGLAERLAVALSRPELLRRALVHRSWCAEHDEPHSYERLEFLGDAVLGLVVTDHVYHHFPELPEGNLSEVRAGVVNAEVLADVARDIDLGRFLLLGKGEAAAGGREKQSILADALEAVIAAVYLDVGLDETRRLVLGWLEPRILAAAEGPGGRDAKTRLQEIAARRGLGRPRYEVHGEGPDHAKRFTAVVHLDGVACGTGEGRSKKQAEQAAAWVAYRTLVADGYEGDGDAGAA